MVNRDRRTRSTHDREQARQRQQEKLTALHETLRTQVDQLVHGRPWQEWLAFASRFHTYSFRNLLLILAQNPEATLVAGYTTWQKLGRQVRKGETGIQIYAPVTARRGTSDPREPDPQNPDTAEGPRADPPAPDTQKTNRGITGVKVAHVFDVTQTDGDPVPQQPLPTLLAGQAPDGLWDALAHLAETRGYTVQRGDCDGANGRTYFDAKTVRVRADVDDAQAVKTLAHELGHVLLHDNGVATLVCRGVVEVEAESVAFLVAAHHGLDTASYTFPYVATWAERTGEDPAKVVHTTGQRVITAAHHILEHTTTVLGDPRPKPAPPTHQPTTATPPAPATAAANRPDGRTAAAHPPPTTMPEAAGRTPAPATHPGRRAVARFGR
jgi:antirestriction protein ArdC